MIDPSRPRRLIIHAGTHKTASTYIQARLHLNRDLLLSQRITYRFPSSESTTFKSLTKAISDDAWSRWDDYLSSFDQSPNDVLISAEQFSSRLCDPKVIARLRRVASTHGYELSIVIFIRSQLDYINSRYAYASSITPRPSRLTSRKFWTVTCPVARPPVAQATERKPNGRTSLISGTTSLRSWKHAETALR